MFFKFKVASQLIHIISLNSQGLRNKDKRIRLKEYTKEQKIDILFLQETHFTDEIAYTLRTEFDNFLLFHAYGSSSSRGCSIFINKALQHDIIDSHKDPLGRYILLNIIIDDTTYTLVNVYAYNDKVSRNMFFESINELVENNYQGVKIIGGDFNDVLESTDRYNENSKTRTSHKPVKTLIEFIKSHNLADAWREKNKSKKQFTWKRKSGNERSRIDLWLVESNIMPQVQKADIRPACIKYTDHLAISIKLSRQNKRGPGFWKFNNMHLKDSKFINIISDLIKYNAQKYEHQSAKNIWELTKIDIKEATINYSKQQSKQRRERLTLLEHHLAELHSMDDENNRQSDATTKQSIIRLENEIQMLYDVRAKGAQIRSRIDYIEEGEKCTKYFLNLEKSRQSRKAITSLNINNKQVCDNSKILQEEVKFYQTLYTSKTISKSDMHDYIDNTTFSNKLTEEEANLCEGIFELDELTDAVKQMKSNKSPGLDGLTSEFYQQFWPLIGTIITNSLNDSFVDMQMSHSQKISALSLIYKKGDPSNLENWRPISLLNNDYKIAARALANRLKKVIHKIVHMDQQGYIQNRFIGYNLRQIQDVIDYADNLQLEGAILFLDFRKAFDTIEWDFLYRVLHLFGFKEQFIKWIKTLYTDCKSCIFNNGYKSQLFNPSRGIRQGCPISALLYILAAEVLANNIRNSNHIEGIEVKLINEKRSLKISQLADDTTLFLKNKNEIISSLDIIKEFGKYSGLELNQNKTEGMWLGIDKLKKEKVGNISWPEGPIKALGVYFGHNTEECTKLNWETKLTACKSIVDNWRKRRLTFYGKIQIIKTLLIPKFTYLFHSLVVPKTYLVKINSLIYGFLWDGKREKIKRSTLIGNKQQGGLEMIDLETYITTLKLKWIKSFLTEDNANWKVLPKLHFEVFGKDFLVFHYNLDSIKTIHAKHLPEFYKNLLELWIRSNNNKKTHTSTFEDIRKQILWGNKFIKHNGKCLVFTSWINSNLIFINDIINEKGEVKENFILEKLLDKRDWISEVTKVIRAIPKRWKTLLKTEASCKTKVKTNLSLSIGKLNYKESNNKVIYQQLLSEIFHPPIMHRFWNDKFDDNLPWLDIYTFINRLFDNRHKQYKFKTINNIFPSRAIRYRWKMENSPNCIICNELEDYEHIFVNCSRVQAYWSKIISIFKACGIENNIKTLKTLIVGYKITHTDYFYVNVILTIVGFGIYKSYFASENWAINVDIYRVFVYEIQILLQFLKHRGVSNPFISRVKGALQLE